MRHLKKNKQYFSKILLINKVDLKTNISFDNEITSQASSSLNNSVVFSPELDTSPNKSSSETKTRHVRLVYCSDGVVEECDEDEEEKQRQEREQQEKELERRRKLDLEAKNMKWLPWIGYMTHKTAIKTVEACDYMGEKLAWWFGITQPKFLYEIQEYERIKKEEEDSDDRVEEIVIGKVAADGRRGTVEENLSTVDGSLAKNFNDVEMRLYENDPNIDSVFNKKSNLFQS